MLTIKAKKRKELGNQVKKLRQKGFVPAIVYGHKIKSLPLTLSAPDIENLVKKIGESTIINLDIEGQGQRKVLIAQVDHHPLTGKIEHVDFYQIREKEKVTADVELEFVGQPPAVKEKGGLLFTNLDHLEIEALPADLPPKIKVDISHLSNIDDQILVKDLSLPPGVKVSQEEEELIVKIIPPRREEEVEEEVEGEETAPEEEKKEEKVSKEETEQGKKEEK